MYIILVGCMINCLIFPVTFSQTGSDKNIAIGKMIIPPCIPKPKGKSVITDGRIDSSGKMDMENTCGDTELFQLRVILPPTKGIGNVVVYAGDCKDCDDLLDNFFVQLYLFDDDRENKQICGQYPGKFLEPGRPMRVNCDLRDNFNEVISVGIEPNAYQLNVSKKGSISEVEVYLKEYWHEKGYYGCYMNFFKAKEYIITEETSCKTTCYEMGETFMTLMSDGTCMCSSTVPEMEMPSAWCSLSCSYQSDILCAQYEAYPVYIARSPNIHAVGCFKHESTKEGFKIKDMTPAKCLIKCADRSVIYSVLKGTECFCEESISMEVADAHLCNEKCPGNDRSCGGPTYGLVYTGCEVNIENTPCHRVYKCVDENFDEFGVCFGSCSESYYGKHCLTKDIPIPPPIPTIIPANFSIDDDDDDEPDGQGDMGEVITTPPGAKRSTHKRATRMVVKPTLDPGNKGDGKSKTVRLPVSAAEKVKAALEIWAVLALLPMVLMAGLG